jgi:hypothetical protein
MRDCPTLHLDTNKVKPDGHCGIYKLVCIMFYESSEGMRDELNLLSVY